MQVSDVLESVDDLRRHGHVVLPGLYPAEQVAWARSLVLRSLPLFKNTRPNPSAGHLAGFHRYPELEPLHISLSSHPLILQVLRQAAGCETMRSIGLSDITVNRSQAWHVDLLRGKYRHYLDAQTCWGPEGGGVYKVLVYLQPGKSLQVASGRHLVPLSLDDDRASVPGPGATTTAIHVQAGDAVLMDVRLPHCGSSEEELAQGEYLDHPKILVSTVLGASGRPMARGMERGNLERLLDWEAAHA